MPRNGRLRKFMFIETLCVIISVRSIKTKKVLMWSLTKYDSFYYFNYLWTFYLNLLKNIFDFFQMLFSLRRVDPCTLMSPGSIQYWTARSSGNQRSQGLNMDLEKVQGLVPLSIRTRYLKRKYRYCILYFHPKVAKNQRENLQLLIAFIIINFLQDISTLLNYLYYLSDIHF